MRRWLLPLLVIGVGLAAGPRPDPWTVVSGPSSGVRALGAQAVDCDDPLALRAVLEDLIPVPDGPLELHRRTHQLDVYQVASLRAVVDRQSCTLIDVHRAVEPPTGLSIAPEVGLGCLERALGAEGARYISQQPGWWMEHPVVVVKGTFLVNNRWSSWRGALDPETCEVRATMSDEATAITGWAEAMAQVRSAPAPAVPVPLVGMVVETDDEAVWTITDRDGAFTLETTGSHTLTVTDQLVAPLTIHDCEGESVNRCLDRQPGTALEVSTTASSGDAVTLTLAADAADPVADEYLLATTSVLHTVPAVVAAYEELLGIEVFDPEDPVQVYANVGRECISGASYQPYTNSILLPESAWLGLLATCNGTTSLAPYTNSSHSGPIVAHETGHVLHFWTAGNVGTGWGYSGELTAGLSEGFADATDMWFWGRDYAGEGALSYEFERVDGSCSTHSDGCDLDPSSDDFSDAYSCVDEGVCRVNACTSDLECCPSGSCVDSSHYCDLDLPHPDAPEEGTCRSFLRWTATQWTHGFDEEWGCHLAFGPGSPEAEWSPGQTSIFRYCIGTTLTAFAWAVAEDQEFEPGTEGMIERLLGTQPLAPAGGADVIYDFFLLDDDDGDLENGTPNCEVIDRHARERDLHLAWQTERCPLDPSEETCCWDEDGSGAAEDCGLEAPAAPAYPFPSGCPTALESPSGCSCNSAG